MNLQGEDSRDSSSGTRMTLAWASTTTSITAPTSRTLDELPGYKLSIRCLINQQNSKHIQLYDARGNRVQYPLFPYVQSSTAYQYEVAGSKEGVGTASTATNYTYDTYGNLTDTVVTTTDTDSTAPVSPYNGQVWISEIKNTITNDTTNWCLGIPNRTQTIDTVPGQAAQTPDRRSPDGQYRLCGLPCHGGSGGTHRRKAQGDHDVRL